MKRVVKRLGALAFPAAAMVGAVGAHAAENLPCVETGYDAAQTLVIEDFVRNFESANFTGTGPLSDAFEDRLTAMVNVIATRAEYCADVNGWQEATTQRAVFYEMSGVMLRGMQVSGLYTSHQISRLRTGLAEMEAQTHQTMREAFLSAASANQVVQLQPREQRALDALARGMGIPASDLQRLDGLRQWLRASFMREQIAAEFPSL